MVINKSVSGKTKKDVYLNNFILYISMALTRKMIGEGSTGIIIRPTYQCTDGTMDDDVDFVSKIADEQLLRIENAAYQLLPDKFNGLLYYKNVKLCTRFDNDQVQLILPFIEGPTVAQLDVNASNVNEIIHTTFMFMTQLKTMYAEFGILHKDIKEANVMYDTARHQFVLIDFGSTKEGYTLQKEYGSLIQVCICILKKIQKIKPDIVLPEYQSIDLILGRESCEPLFNILLAQFASLQTSGGRKNRLTKQKKQIKNKKKSRCFIKKHYGVLFGQV
jgi:serine/threonine protein kinase